MVKGKFAKTSKVPKYYESGCSIVAVKSKNSNKYFKFNSASKVEIEKGILNLDSSKAYQNSDIPTKIIKFNSDILTYI